MNHCANCGTRLHGAYCSQCGQSAHEGHAPTLAHFFHEVTRILSAVYLYLSLKRLFGESGLLTAFKTALMYGYLFFIELFLALIGMSTVMARMR